MARDDSFIPQRANYKTLLSYQKAECICDITYFFTHNFLEKGDRTIDQMIQAARSGKQNIVEGVAAGVTSKETEIKLVNVAKASLQELRIDYEDFLRVRGAPQWQRGEEKFERARTACSNHNESSYYIEVISKRSPETIANIALILIAQADFLLFRQIESLKKAFLENGGLREEMSRARRARRGY